MQTITVDDERFARTALIRLLTKIDPEGIHEGVQNADELLAYVKEHDVEIAFVDVDMYGMDGITLTKELAVIKPDLNVIIYTGHPEFKADALDLYVSGYIVKPVSEEILVDAIDHLRYPIRQLKVQCFGPFEVFYGGQPVKFERKDSKEVLAYLIHKRGAEVSEEELRYLIWTEKEDTPKKKNYIRNIIYDIRTVFSRYGISDVINNSHGCYSVNVNKLKCDYYDYLDGKDISTSSLGEYMEQFSSWSGATKFKLFKN